MVRMTIEITKSAEQTLRRQAEREGQPVEQLATDILQTRVQRLADFEELAAEASTDFARIGMTDDELGDLLERIKHADRGVPYDA